MTGAALVDGSSLAGVDLASLPPRAQTPVYGLPRYPVNRYAMPKPKIALFSNGATAPANPIQIGGGAKSACSGGFCEALFVLTQKMKIPPDLILPMTTTDLAAGKLVSDGYTAFINPAHQRRPTRASWTRSRRSSTAAAATSATAPTAPRPPATPG